MLLSDENASLRRILAEPSNTGRWADTDTTDFINRARKAISLDLEWPEATLAITAVSGVQEYLLPEINKLLRVYVAGQQIVPTSIPLMQGDQIELFDQTAPNFQPQWKSVASATYPVGSDLGFPQSRAPFFPGMRPRFYFRGGNLGLVPAPLGTPAIAIDIVPTPPLLVNQSDTDIFPDNFREALVWKAAELALFGDNPNTEKLQLSDAAYQKYRRELTKLLSWKRALSEQGPNGPQVFAYRAFYQGVQPLSNAVATGLVEDE